MDEMNKFIHPSRLTIFRTKEKMSNTIYYRPEWTCGRYNAEHNAALYYNLLEGMCYFFEDYSALVVSKILYALRNTPISVAGISESTGVAQESIEPFLKDLSMLGLILDHIPTKEEVSDYRKQLGVIKNGQALMAASKTTREKLPMDVSTAEMDYTDKVGGITSVMFELTYRCSEKCIHCYNIGATRNNKEESGRGLLHELQLSDYKRIIDELYEEGLTKVCLSGGDPFSYPFVWEIIDYLYNKEVAFDIYTNGQRLIGNEQRLANYYPRLVGLSVYSNEAQCHDSITRIKGSLEKTISVMGCLSSLGVPLVVKCCIMRPNVTSYQAVKELARKYGAITQFELNVTDSIEGDKCVSKYLRLKPELLDVVLRDDDTPMYVGQEAPNYGGQVKDMKRNACGAGYNTFCITPDGELIPCCAFHMSFGNLLEKSVKDIFYNSKLLKWWKDQTLYQYEECGQHPYCDYCNLCAGNNYSQNGTPLKAAENNCYMAKCRYDLAKRLMCGEDPLDGKTIEECLLNINDEQIPLSSLRREFDDNNGRWINGVSQETLL